MIELIWPWVFVLAPLPLIVMLLPGGQARQQAALRIPFYRQLADAKIGSSASAPKQQWLPLVLLWLAWLCLLLAGARPVLIGEPTAIPATGRDLLLAVDISGSMAQEDMVIEGNSIQRITVVKAVVSQFLAQREGDKVGLILFGSEAYLQAPLTFDLATVGTLLNEARIGFAGKSTAIGDALGLAVKRLQSRPEASRVVVLLTDGANTSGAIAPLQAAKLAAQAGVKVYTVGIGADIMEIPGLFGSRLGARRINPSADLDEVTLTEIAALTGGKYYRARDPKELVEIYNTISTLEPVDQDEEIFRPQSSVLHWPLAAALLMMLILAVAQAEFRGDRAVAR